MFVAMPVLVVTMFVFFAVRVLIVVAVSVLVFVVMMTVTAVVFTVMVFLMVMTMTAIAFTVYVTFAATMVAVMAVMSAPVLFVMMMFVATMMFHVMVFLMVMTMTTMMSLLFKLFQLAFKGVGVFHSRKNLLAVKLVPRGCDDCRRRIMSADKFNRVIQFFRTGNIGMAENYAGCALYLVVEKFPEIFHIHFAFSRVHYRRIRINFTVFEICAFNRLDYVRKLAHARRLDKYAVGMIFGFHLFKRFRKIAYKRTADTS